MAMKEMLRPGIKLYRMDYHISGKEYVVSKYDNESGLGEIEDEATKDIFMFNNWTLQKGVLNLTPQEAFNKYSEEKEEVNV